LEAFYELIKRVVGGFNAVGLDYMFTGALAASFYGVPRTTVDVDIVVKVAQERDKAKLVSGLRQAGLRVDEKKIEVVLKSSYRIVTFRDSKSPHSVDIIVSEEKKLEKKVGTIAGLPTFYQTPEDLILAKLRMIKATVPRERTQKDREDIRAILRFTKVNVEAVKKQARRNNMLSVFESTTAKTDS